MVPASAAREEDQLQRRVLDGEVGVPVLDLGRGGSKQLGVERNSLVEVIDVQREL